MATGTIKNLGKQIVVETGSIPITQGNDYCYVSAKDGYNLISAIFTKSWGEASDTIDGVAWSGYNYILFLRGAPTVTENRTIMLTWCEN